VRYKINSKRLLDISEKLFNFYYNIDNISDMNLDGYLTYYTDGVIKLQVRTHNDRKYLAYMMRDRDQLRSILPVSNYMFDKLIEKWFSKKYNINIDSVLKPIRR
jgi:hypothetical protein